nr:unnamed protein product [Callosobruchus analis]
MDKHRNSEYTCSFCAKVFKVRKLMSRHKCKEKNAEIRKFVCERCGVELSSKQVLKKHINAHDGIKPYKCQVCRDTLATLGVYKIIEEFIQTKSLTLYVLREMFQAKVCTEHSCEETYWGNALSLRGLIKLGVNVSCHAGRKRKNIDQSQEWKCRECSKIFRSRRHLYSHGKAVHVPEIHSCDVCGKTFKLLSILKNHKTYAHTDARNYKCDMCDSKFKTKSTLKVHEKRVHLKKMEKFCQHCGEGFILDCELREHQRIKHDKILYSCSDCDKKFVSKSGLWLHLENHRDSQYTCSFCTKIFKFRRQLRRHVCKQKDSKKYVCDRCGKELTSKKAMKNHINMHKYGAMKYICDRCSKVLTSKKALKDHVNAHDGIKPYKCDVCSESLASSGTLLVHKRIHTGAKPYVCTLCAKRFRQKNSLTRHKRTHVGEVWYTCKVCFQNFISNDVLKNHKCTSENK